MTLQIRSHIEHLMRTDKVLILYLELKRNVAELAVLIRFNDGF